MTFQVIARYNADPLDVMEMWLRMHGDSCFVRGFTRRGGADIPALRHEFSIFHTTNISGPPWWAVEDQAAELGLLTSTQISSHVIYPRFELIRRTHASTPRNAPRR